MPMMNNKRNVTILCIVIAILLIVASLIGCNGSGKGKYASEKKGIASIVVETNKEGNISRFFLNQDRSTTTDQRVETQLPPNAKEGSSMTMTDEGTSFGFGSSYEAAAIDWTKKNQVWYTVAAIACFVAAAVCFRFPGTKAMILPLIGVGLFLMYVPTIIDRTGAIMAFLVVVGILGFGVLWIVGRARGEKLGESKVVQKANVAAAQLNAKGMSDVSTAVRRIIDSDYNAAYQSTKTATAVKKATKADPLADVTPSAVVVPIVPVEETPVVVQASNP